MSTGSITTEEGDLPTEKAPETKRTTIAKLLFAFTGLFERWRNEMEARRYRDPREQDPDYARRLRELEGQIADIDREQQGFRITNNEGGGGKDSSWKDWILMLVGLAIVGWLARISLKMDDLQEIKTEQRDMEKHLESTDSRVDRIETRVYREKP